jgi:hypothetical protein
MRRRGERIDNGNGDDATVQQVADVRRGQPDIGGWTAEAEKLAGSGIGARGGGVTGLATRALIGKPKVGTMFSRGTETTEPTTTRAEVIKGAGGVSPETIQEQKAQL